MDLSNYIDKFRLYVNVSPEPETSEFDHVLDLLTLTRIHIVVFWFQMSLDELQYMVVRGVQRNVFA